MRHFRILAKPHAFDWTPSRDLASLGIIDYAKCARAQVELPGVGWAGLMLGISPFHSSTLLYSGLRSIKVEWEHRSINA